MGRTSGKLPELLGVQIRLELVTSLNAGVAASTDRCAATVGAARVSAARVDVAEGGCSHGGCSNCGCRRVGAARVGAEELLQQGWVQKSGGSQGGCS